jgi:hypothetical protein
MGVPTLEVGYTSATTGRGDHEVHKGHVVALGNKIIHKKQLHVSVLTKSVDGFVTGRNVWLFIGNNIELCLS